MRVFYCQRPWVFAGQQVGNPRLQEVVYAVADAVQEGLSFGVAFAAVSARVYQDYGAVSASG